MAQVERSVVTFPARREEVETVVETVAETVVERYATPMAVIRTAAEVLRDTPELSAEDRARFAEMVLSAEERLEELLDELRRPDAAA